jgi:hypothetical protein
MQQTLLPDAVRPKKKRRTARALHKQLKAQGSEDG